MCLWPLSIWSLGIEKHGSERGWPSPWAYGFLEAELALSGTTSITPSLPRTFLVPGGGKVGQGQVKGVGGARAAGWCCVKRSEEAGSPALGFQAGQPSSRMLA